MAAPTGPGSSTIESTRVVLADDSQVGRYCPNGLPAAGYVNFLRVPTASDQLVISVAGSAFVYGLDFGGFDTPTMAESLANTVNGVATRFYPSLSQKNVPAKQVTRSVYAVARDSVVVLIARVPGTGGNGLALSSSNATFASVTAFSGGTDVTPGRAAGVALEEHQKSQIFTEYRIRDLIEAAHLFGYGTLSPGQISKAPAATATPEAISANDLLVVAATIVGRRDAATANASEVRIGSSTAQNIPLQASEIYVLGPIFGRKFNLKEWYVKSNTVTDGVVVQYV